MVIEYISWIMKTDDKESELSPAKLNGIRVNNEQARPYIYLSQSPKNRKARRHCFLKRPFPFLYAFLQPDPRATTLVRTDQCLTRRETKWFQGLRNPWMKSLEENAEYLPLWQSTVRIRTRGILAIILKVLGRISQPSKPGGNGDTSNYG